MKSLQYFLKIGQDVGENISASKIEKLLLMYILYLSQPGNFYHGFYNASDTFSPKIKKIMSAVSNFKKSESETSNACRPLWNQQG